MSPAPLLVVMATSTSHPPLSSDAVQVLAAYARQFTQARGTRIVPCPPARQVRQDHAPNLGRTRWARATNELRAVGLLHTTHMAGRWVTGLLLPRDVPELRPWAWSVAPVSVPRITGQQLAREAGTA